MTAAPDMTKGLTDLEARAIAMAREEGATDCDLFAHRLAYKYLRAVAAADAANAADIAAVPDGLVGRLQAAWDSVEDLPPIDFTDVEALALSVALASRPAPEVDAVKRASAIAVGMAQAFAQLAVSTRYDGVDRERWNASRADAEEIINLLAPVWAEK